MLWFQVFNEYNTGVVLKHAGAPNHPVIRPNYSIETGMVWGMPLF